MERLGGEIHGGTILAALRRQSPAHRVFVGLEQRIPNGGEDRDVETPFAGRQSEHLPFSLSELETEHS
jgi:hypothetical protein